MTNCNILFRYCYCCNYHLTFEFICNCEQDAYRQEFNQKCSVCKCNAHDNINCYTALENARAANTYNARFICECSESINLHENIPCFFCEEHGKFCIVCGKHCSDYHIVCDYLLKCKDIIFT